METSNMRQVFPASISLIELGKLYRRGGHVSRNIDTAIDLFKIAASLGATDALFELGELSLENPEEIAAETVELMESAAYQGCAAAQLWLACNRYYGRRIQRNTVEAYHWLSRVSQNDDCPPEVFYLLGKSIISGDGVPEADYKVAVMAFHKALFKSGLDKWGKPLHEKGKESVAREHLLSETKVRDIQFLLGVSRYSGLGLEGNDRMAFCHLVSSVLDDDAHAIVNPEAEYLIGKCFYYGLGIKKNLSQALFWFEVSAKNGSSQAAFMLKRIKGMGTDKQ